MKIISLLTFLIYSLNHLQAQAEFPKLNASWCYRAYGDHGENLYNFCVGPDSIINVGGINYSRVSFKNNLSPEFDTILYREEDRKLFILPEDSIREILLCDFNLNLGDTFLNPRWGTYPYSSSILTVIDISYLITNDGVSRKIMQLSAEGPEFLHTTWIEGIGDISWLFLVPNYLGTISGGFIFICHSIDGKVIYGDENSCYSWIGTNDRKSLKSFKFYPNPTLGKFSFTTIESFKELKIYNVWGQEVAYKITNQEIDISHLKAGIYIVVITDQNNNQYFSKIVKL
ncbi:MAG: T9SS type A sorting domain-containing protein [Saprospiraceae bacterium]|nr:T9SS type A sorting domain-containing protein [Candidatus Brachybacter algidus]